MIWIDHEGPGYRVAPVASPEAAPAPVPTSARLVIACVWREDGREFYEPAPRKEKRRVHGRILRPGMSIGSRTYLGRRHVEERLLGAPLPRLSTDPGGRPSKALRRLEKESAPCAPAHVWLVGPERVYEPAERLDEVLMSRRGKAITAGMKIDGRTYFGRLMVPAHLIRPRRSACFAA